MTYIEVKNLTKSYGNNIVLKNISVQMEKGSLTSLLGASGSGKSTLLRSIAGLEQIDSGNIFINGKDITNLEPKNRNIGMVFQHYALFPNLTVDGNVRFGLDIKKIPENEKKKKVHKMIELVGLSGKEEEYPRNLSGGQMQRVALARSLVTEPNVLFLDEPLSALDAKIRIELRKLIKNLQRELGITIVLVTHDQEEAMTMSEKIYVMNKGDVEQFGTPSEIYRHPKTPYVANFIGNHNLFSREEFSLLTREKNIEENLIAIRPETITTIKPKESHYVFSAKVIRSSMLGSQLRFWMEVGPFQIIMDTLNRSINFIKDGEEIVLYVLKEDIIKVKNAQI